MVLLLCDSPEARVGILTHHSKAVLLYVTPLLVLSYCGILSYQGLHHCCILPTPTVAEANNKHRPQFHGRIIYACTFETVTAARPVQLYLRAKVIQLFHVSLT